MRKRIVAAAVLAGIALTAAQAAPLPEAKPDEVGFSQTGLSRLDDFFARAIQHDAELRVVDNVPLY